MRFTECNKLMHRKISLSIQNSLLALISNIETFGEARQLDSYVRDTTEIVIFLLRSIILFLLSYRCATLPTWH